MTPNDAQIDLLLRRHAGQTRPGQGQGESAAEHLDADELNAFAEGSLPAAARSRYVSHLADCDACRKVASQLAISGGAVVAAEAKNTADPQGYSWWKSLSGFLSPLTLRYAAFAVVLVMVVGVVVLVTRRPRESDLTAQNEPAKQTQVAAVKAPDAGAPQSIQNGAVKTDQPRVNLQGPASPVVSNPEELKSGQVPAPPAPKPERETAETTAPVLAAKKAAEPMSTEQAPAYAPPPPGEAARAGTVSNERQEMQRNAPSGPRKSESPYDKSKMMDQSRAGEMPKDNRARDDGNRIGLNQTQGNIQRDADEKVQTGRNTDNLSSRDRNARASQPRAPAAQSAGTGSRNDASAKEEEAPQTRSAGGRKFKRQGNAWVDSKFKSSMTLKSISRGSSEFDALDSGLRSIAQQISGEVIVVWKNKAYLIR
jgi:hypothetical protein